MNILIIVIFFVFGILFYLLAKKYSKNGFVYFLLGTMSFASIAILYCFIYGAIVDFKINSDFYFHRNLSVFLGFFFSILIYYYLRNRLVKRNRNKMELNEIGESEEYNK